jgi:hypothetical protein
MSDEKNAFTTHGYPIAGIVGNVRIEPCQVTAEEPGAADGQYASTRDPKNQILRLARTYGHAGCEPKTHLFCRLVQAIGAMSEREQEYLLQELRGGA